MGTIAERLRALSSPMALIVGKFPGWEPESLKLQPAMVKVHDLQSWALELISLATEVERIAGEMRAERLDEPGTPMWIHAWAHDMADALASRTK